MAVGNDLQDRIARYIDDAIAFEEASITGLKDMIGEATDPTDAAMFQEHLTVTESQRNRLTARLKALGQDRSHNVLKDMVNKIGVAATDMLHGGKDAGDKATRNLVQAYAIESCEVAMYESLIAAATEAGDTETAALAKEIQSEEQRAQQMILPRIAPMARQAVVRGVQS